MLELAHWHAPVFGAKLAAVVLFQAVFQIHATRLISLMVNE